MNVLVTLYHFFVVGVVVVKERCGGVGLVFAEVEHQAAQRFGRAPGRVVSGPMAYLFALDSILLVRKLERGK